MGNQSGHPGVFGQGQNVPLNIAVTGETGSGKSTFVNAIRGIDNKDEKAAATGCVETTMEVTVPHPNYPNVIFWDLPGIGSTNYPAAKYLKMVGFEKFDFFIIISMEKKFYFVRSKIDDNIQRTLTQIRNNCLQDLRLQSPQVFLVSSFDLTLYDFPLLVETLKEELPELKKKPFCFLAGRCRHKYVLGFEVIKSTLIAVKLITVLKACLTPDHYHLLNVTPFSILYFQSLLSFPCPIKAKRLKNNLKKKKQISNGLHQLCINPSIG
uniref:IRG-type G domain-containing protein n=1 Tax=Labrus bergylta TaxID=56723 RepID=A0A3Q3FGY5_9LABR